MSSDLSDESNSENLSKTVCFLCRQRKTKCDRRLPRCGFCVKAKVDCQYVPRPKKRGLRAGYVSELESRIDSLENEIHNLKDQRTSIIAATPPSGSHSRTPFTPTTPASNILPSLGISTPSSVRDATIGDNGAINDMMTLPHAYFQTLADLWFKETQQWVPIFSYQQIQASLSSLPTPVDRIDDIALRAIIALEIAYSSQAICLGYHGRRRLSLYLRSQVVLEAMANPSFSSLQALVVIAILDYGSDNIPSTFSLLAICRRMCENIGMFKQLLNRIEAESPAQVGPPAREAFGGDDSDIGLTWCILSLDAVASLGVSWRDVSAALVEHLSSVAYLSTPDYRDSFRTHTHLAAIGLQPVHEFFYAYVKGQHSVLDDSTVTVCEDLYQNLMSYVHGLPATTYTLLADGAVDFDICHVFTRIVSHAAIIMIYQRYVLDADGSVEIARQRCLESYNEIITIIRNISDVDAEINSPLLASLVFVAARFKLTFDRALEQAREPLFDVVMHGMMMCARRWPLARRLDIILRAAIAEIDSGEGTSLPQEFWDLKLSSLDTSESLKKWVHSYKPSIFVGSLIGPYI